MGADIVNCDLTFPRNMHFTTLAESEVAGLNGPGFERRACAAVATGSLSEAADVATVSSSNPPFGIGSGEKRGSEGCATGTEG